MIDVDTPGEDSCDLGGYELTGVEDGREEFPVGIRVVEPERV